MNKYKEVTKYILAFFVSIFILLLSILTILKTTVYNKDYLKDTLEKNNYFKLSYDEISNNMKNYMVSSGLGEEVLDNLYTKEQIKKDIYTYIDNYYAGKLEKIDTSVINKKLSENINKYAENKNITLENQDAIVNFVDNMENIYKKEITYYGTLNNYVNYFKKSEKIVSVLIIILVGLTVICLGLFVLKRFKYIGSVIIGSSLMLLFVRYVVYNKIEYSNIVIISNNFSIILRKILEYIATQMTIYAVIQLVIGLLISIVISIFKPYEYKSKKKVKRS